MLSAAAMVAACCSGGQVRADLGFDAAALSDYRYRGVSLSDGRPALQVSAAYDHPSGLFAGVLASTVQFEDQATRHLGATAYVGWAGRLQEGWSWETGAKYSGFSSMSDYDYPEFFVGLGHDGASVRLYYSHRYFGGAEHSVYLEAEGSRRLTDQWRVFAHGGLLHLDGPSVGADTRGMSWDVRAGIGTEFRTVRFELALVSSNAPPGIYWSDAMRRSTVVLSVSRAF